MTDRTRADMAPAEAPKTFISEVHKHHTTAKNKLKIDVYCAGPSICQIEMSDQ